MTTKRKCWVPTCINPDLDPKKRSFALPENAQTREVWLALSGKPTESVSTEGIFFCQDHFSAQDILRMDENKQYHNKHRIFPINYMPDRMCGTCMSLIPPENSFHIVSSKFSSDMPPIVEDILNFMVPSKPEPLHQIFTFCMKELKLPRDPPPVACNDCFINAWVYFVFKMTCIEVQNDLKADMSWENYGKKVLCRSCPQIMGTNFISLASSPSMASLLQNMFIGHCPPPDIVPLQVCITCYNVLERIDKFCKNCLEAEEKMQRHVALKKKLNRLSDSSSSSTSTLFTRSSVSNKTCGITIQSERGPMLGFPAEKVNEKIKIENVGSSRSSKVLLAQLMLEHGQALRNDVYQQDVWSVICEKMQQHGVGCNVPGLMKVWRDMVQDTKSKFDMKQTIGPCDKLVMQFHNTLQSVHAIAKNVRSSSASSSSSEPPNITAPEENKAKKFRPESPDKTIPILEDESKPVKKPTRTKKKPIDLPVRINAWAEENKMEFLDILEKEYLQYVAKVPDGGKRRSLKNVCANIASAKYYTIKDEAFFHRLWLNLKVKAECDKTKGTPLNKKVWAFLKLYNAVINGKPIPISNEDKVELIGLFDKHAGLMNGKWPPAPEYWDAVAKDFAKVNPLYDAVMVKRTHRNLRDRFKTKPGNLENDLDRLWITYWNKHLKNSLGNLPFTPKTITTKNAAQVLSPVSSKSSTRKPSTSQTSTTPPAPITTRPAGKRGRPAFDLPALAAGMVAIFDRLAPEEIADLGGDPWAAILKRLVDAPGAPVKQPRAHALWKIVSAAAADDADASEPAVMVRELMRRYEEATKGAGKKTEADAGRVGTSEGKVANTTATDQSPTQYSFSEKVSFVDNIAAEYDSLAQRNAIDVSRSPWCAVIQKVVQKDPSMSFQKAYALWSRLKVSAMSHRNDGSDPLDVQIWNLLQRHQEMVKRRKMERSGGEVAEQPAATTQGLSTIRKSNSETTGLRRTPSMSFLEKQTFVNDMISEFNVVEREDAVLNSRSIWVTVLQRVVQKNPSMSFQKAYALWSRLKVSARSHERDGSDPFDVQVWNLLERKRNMMKNRKNATKNPIDDGEIVVETKVIAVAQSDTPDEPNQEPTEVVASKKRPSDSSEVPESKKKRYALMDATAFNKLEPQQHDEILKLLSDTFEQMRAANERDVRWKSVIARIYQNGGYRDIIYKDFVCLFNRMRAVCSERKYAGNMSASDEKMDALLRKVSAYKQAQAQAVGGKKPEKKHPVKYEQDYAYKPHVKVAPGGEGGKGKVAPGSGGAESPRKRKSASNVLFNFDESYDNEDFEISPKKHSGSWSKEEKLALISAVKSQGNAVFKVSRNHKAWMDIRKDFVARGYERSASAIHSYWSYMRRHAEMAWANQTPSTDVDEALIEFMTTAIREREEPAAAAARADSGSDSDSRDKSADDGVVDLTYDYVSFDDIERLSMESVAGRSVKTEDSPDVFNDGEDDDAKSSVNFVLTKIEGGIDIDEGVETSQPEFVTAEQIGLCKPEGEAKEQVEENGASMDGAENANDEETTETEESVFEENGSARSEAAVASETCALPVVDEVYAAVQDP